MIIVQFPFYWRKSGKIFVLKKRVYKYFRLLLMEICVRHFRCWLRNSSATWLKKWTATWPKSRKNSKTFELVSPFRKNWTLFLMWLTSKFLNIHSLLTALFIKLQAKYAVHSKSTVLLSELLGSIDGNRTFFYYFQ